MIPAYFHKSEGLPGVDAGTGWIQEARLTFTGAKWHGSFSIGNGWLLSGEIAISPGESMSMISVPIKASGVISAKFPFSNDCRLEIEAASVQFTLLGEGKHIENCP